jgi:NAD(P)-dependent dehydrogenase (short-subunit alcohol dehydrogenase family)
MAGILQDKVALVTGGASGIGRATAVTMAREGARASPCPTLSKDGLEATVALINSHGGQSMNRGSRLRPCLSTNGFFSKIGPATYWHDGQNFARLVGQITGSISPVPARQRGASRSS